MSPEALDETKLYTAKLSFGVIALPILTRLLLKPYEHVRDIYVEEINEELREIVPEVERQKAHLKLVPDNHPLKPIVIECLKQNESERPTALHLSKRLSELENFLPQIQLHCPPQS